jgi:hypothetical protein
MHLAPGDKLKLESDVERISFRPVRPHATLGKEYGVWVYHGEPADVSIPNLIDRGARSYGEQLCERVSRISVLIAAF